MTNRTVRTVLIAAAVTVGAALAIPAPANAAALEPRADTAPGITSPTSGSTIQPGQLVTGEFGSLVAEGSAVLVHTTPFPPVNGGTMCDGPLVGQGHVGADGSFSVPMTSTVPDGLYMIGACAATASVGGFLVTVDNPFQLSSPATGEALTPDATVAGVGSPGSTVQATDQDGTILGNAVVDTDGTWTLPFSGLAQGPLTVTFTQDAKTFDAEFAIVADSESTPLVDPLVGGATALALLGVGAFSLRRRIAATA